MFLYVCSVFVLNGSNSCRIVFSNNINFQQQLSDSYYRLSCKRECPKTFSYSMPKQKMPYSIHTLLKKLKAIRVLEQSGPSVVEDSVIPISNVYKWKKKNILQFAVIVNI